MRPTLTFERSHQEDLSGLFADTPHNDMIKETPAKVNELRTEDSSLFVMSPNFDDFDKLLNAAAQTLFLHSNPTIAGGAIRDTLLKRPIKDIDLFVTSDVTEASLKQLVAMVNGRDLHSVDESDKGLDYTGSFEIYSFKYDTTFKADVEVQVILVADVDEHIEDTFSIGLSKVSYSNAGLYMSRDFLKDAKDSTITVLTTSTKPEYVARITQKYSSFVLNLERGQVTESQTTSQPKRVNLKELCEASKPPASNYEFTHAREVLDRIRGRQVDRNHS